MSLRIHLLSLTGMTFRGWPSGWPLSVLGSGGPSRIAAWSVRLQQRVTLPGIRSPDNMNLPAH